MHSPGNLIRVVLDLQHVPVTVWKGEVARDGTHTHTHTSRLRGNLEYLHVLEKKWKETRQKTKDSNPNSGTLEL